jgi:SAM-dependent methyltransferase
LRRVKPIGRGYGYSRGTPVDRFYIENFMRDHAPDIRGRVMEIEGDDYAVKYGGDRVSGIEILDINPNNKRATIIADLTKADSVPSSHYDCVILTQVLELIYDVRSAVETLHRILKPGGVVLATVPGLASIGRDEIEHWCWAFSKVSARRLFGEFFDELDVKAHGNALVGVAFIHGVALEELTREEMDHHEPGFEVCVTVRAVKSGNVT